MVGSVSLAPDPGGAPQPLEFAVGSFNFGMPQSMLTAGQASFEKHTKNFTRVVAKLVEEGAPRAVSDNALRQ